MLTKVIDYVDYNGVKRSEKFYFNLSKAELIEMEYSETGGLAQFIENIIETQDHPKIVALFKELVLKAYGEKSADGKRFIKSKELSEAFSQTEAYVTLFMSLATDPKAAADFINGLIPEGIEIPEDAVLPNGVKLQEVIPTT